MYRRMFSLLCIFCALFFLYWGRLFWLQILAPVTDVPAGANALSPSLRQRSEEVVLDPGRGHFYDRHGHPITGFEMTGALFFPLPQSLQNPPWLLKVADILKIPPERLGRVLQNLKAPAFFPQENSRIPLSFLPNKSDPLRLWTFRTCLPSPPSSVIPNRWLPPI